MLRKYLRHEIATYWHCAKPILTDFARDGTKALYEAAKAKGLNASYKEIEGRHYWFIWRDFLADFGARIFK